MMRKTIKVRIVTTDHFDEARQNLEDVGFYFPFDANGQQDAAFFVELKELPEVISALTYNGYEFNELESRAEWMLHRFTRKGISLVVHAFNERAPEQLYERFLFIPAENIIAVHTINDEFLELTQDSAKRRKEKAKRANSSS